MGASGRPLDPPGRGPDAYSAVWSSVGAPGAFFLTDSIPLKAAAFELYISDWAIVSPLPAFRTKWYWPFLLLVNTNLPGISPVASYPIRTPVWATIIGLGLHTDSAASPTQVNPGSIGTDPGTRRTPGEAQLA